MKTFNLEIVATDKVFYNGSAEMLVFPSLDGEQGILADHELMVSPVVAGELRYTIDGEQNLAAVGNGFVEVLGDRVILICDFVERPEDIDIKRAQLAKERAEERIRLKKANASMYTARQLFRELWHDSRLRARADANKKYLCNNARRRSISISVFLYLIQMKILNGRWGHSRIGFKRQENM